MENLTGENGGKVLQIFILSTSQFKRTADDTAMFGWFVLGV